MDSALRPRDIQARIRAGQSPEEVAEVAGIPVERVGVFAGPVLAEREHVAQQATAATVRRRGETSGHRNLGSTLIDKLSSRNIDDDTLAWDSAKMDDGRWSVTATYDTGESQRQAIFYYDVKARFSVAANDDARWVLGEQTMARSTGDAADDNEPTVDLSDELALVRATQNHDDEVGESEVGQSSDGGARVQELHLVQDEWDAKEAAAYAELQEEGDSEADFDQSDADPETDAEPDAADSDTADTEAGDTEALAPEAGDADEDSGSDADAAASDDGSGDLDTLYEMLGGDGYAEESTRVYSGLSDASAVPETDNAGWEPAIVMNVPAEPGPPDEDEHLFSDQPEVAGPPVAREADNPPASAESPPDAEAPSPDTAEESGTAAAESGGSRRSRRRARKKAAASAASPAVEEPVDEPLPLETSETPIGSAEEHETTAVQPAETEPITPESEAPESVVPESEAPEPESEAPEPESEPLVPESEATEPESEAPEPLVPEHARAESVEPEPTGSERTEQSAPTTADDSGTASVDTPTTPTVESPSHDKPASRDDAASREDAGSDPPQQEKSESPAEPEKPKPKKTAKRKRASVPSWDEIMFGGPPRNSGGSS